MRTRNFCCWSSLKAVALATTVIATGAYAQDECATALTATAGVPAAFSTTGATPSANIPGDALCAGTFLNWLETQNDVWFKFTATSIGQATFSTCNSASYDTSIAIYQNSCTNLVACNGDGTGLAGCQQYYSLVSNLNCSAGDVFYVRIGGYEGDVGTGTLLVTLTEGVAGCIGATGACNVAHGGYGCNNLVCCSAICQLNPLCCELGWDATCVELAIASCGYYSCPAVAGAPANDCATSPTSIPNVDSTVSWSNVGATEDGPDHASACASGVPDFFNDVWYKVVVSANGSLILSTCGTSPFDNKTGVYDLGTDPGSFDYNGLQAAVVACNDDGAGGNCYLTDGTTPYASAMTAAVQMGHTYLIRMGSYLNGETGAGSMTVDLPEPCDIGTAGGTEGESCGSAFNDGCNGAGEFETITLGSSIAGTFWADADERDTDFYQITVTSATQVTATIRSARLSTVLILGGDITVPACAGVSVLGIGTGACPGVATACLNPGTYYVFVGEQLFAGNPCGSGTFNDYTLAVSGAPASCPILVSGSGVIPGVCVAPGPNTNNSDPAPITVTQGLVACGVNPAAPNCSGGGTVGDDYARVFPAGMVSGDISCLDFGVFAVKRAINGAVCANFYSDIPLPASIGIYRDLDGGAPRWYTADGGADGYDLEEIIRQDIQIAGGVYLATLNFAQPICVEEDAAYNLVVILDTPDLFEGLGAGVPAASGYGLRAAGNTPAGTTSSNTYWSAPGCGIGVNNFVLTESAGGTFLAHWIVRLNGDNAAACSAPPCLGDYNGDGIRNGADLTTLLSAWGTPGGDITGDNNTNGADLTTLLSGWGACPN